jgi:hypothetical protein
VYQTLKEFLGENEFKAAARKGRAGCSLRMGNVRKGVKRNAFRLIIYLDCFSEIGYRCHRPRERRREIDALRVERFSTAGVANLPLIMNGQGGDDLLASCIGRKFLKLILGFWFIFDVDRTGKDSINLILLGGHCEATRRCSCHAFAGQCG